MAELQNKDSSTAMRKNSSSIDEDFGKDFLETWKSSKVGKDALDFDVETVPRNGKNSFNFDKFDDFGLDSGFDKLPSFKMDMSDLDFSSPLKKTEKANEKSGSEISTQKQDKEKGKFSFTFDFKELDKFVLDTNLLKGEKKVKNVIDDIRPDKFNNRDKDLDSKRDSTSKVNILERSGTIILSKAENMDTSEPVHMPESDAVETATQSTSSNKAQHDTSQETQRPVEDQVTATEEDKNENHIRREHREQSEGKSLKPCAEKTAQDFALLSVSGNVAVKGTLPQIRKEIVPSYSMKTNVVNQQDSGVKSLDSPQFGSSSPVISYNSRSWTEKGKMGSPDTGSNFQNHENNQVEVSGGNGSRNESFHGRLVDEKFSSKVVPQKIANGIKSIGKKLDPSPTFPSPLNQGFRSFKFVPSKEKTASSLQINPPRKPEGTANQPSVLLTPKLDGLPSMKNVTHAYPANGKRESKNNDEQTAERKGEISTCQEKTVTKITSVAPESDKYVKHRETSCSQFCESNLVRRTTSKTSAQTLLHNLAPSMQFSPTVNSESQDTSQSDERRHNMPGLMTLSLKSRIMKENGSPSNSLMHKGRTVVAISEANLIKKAVGSTITDKSALMSPHLKRKTPEDSVTDTMTLNPLKRINSTVGTRVQQDVLTRYSAEVANNSDIELFSKVPKRATPEVPHHDVSVDDLTSVDNAAEIGNLLDLELPVLIENDGNIEKAEAFSKELDDICNMLKKKHEEAKELLVRAIVNNNTLLMLNHPMIEEKIRVLQRFATSLQSKEYWKS